jgi:hypothetical protein
LMMVDYQVWVKSVALIGRVEIEQHISERIENP